MPCRIIEHGGEASLETVAQLSFLDAGDRVGKVDARIPGLERRHRRQPRQRHAIVEGGGTGEAPAIAHRKTGDPPGQHEARHQPLHVPFERRRQRFVEVVDVKNRGAFGRGVGAEIGEMAIAAGLNAQSS